MRHLFPHEAAAEGNNLRGNRARNPGQGCKNAGPIAGKEEITVVFLTGILDEMPVGMAT